MSSISGGMPRSLSLNSARRLSRIRSTHFSPCTVDVVATRTSSGTPSIVASSWPSCGRRRSTMFMFAMTLMRLTRAGPMFAGSDSTSWSAPSTRLRIRSRSSIGSMCTSDARSVTACDRIRFTTWTTGAFSSTVWPIGSSTFSAFRACARASKTRTCSPTREVALYADVDRAPDVGHAGDVELRRLAELVAELVGERGLRRVRDRDVVAELRAPQRDREPFARLRLGQGLDRVLGRDAACAGPRPRGRTGGRARRRGRAPRGCRCRRGTRRAACPSRPGPRAPPAAARR